MNEPQIKAAVRKRDGHKCTRCGMTNQESLEVFRRSLDVHRLTPGAPYTVEGCVTLCRACHGPEPKLPHGEGARRLHEQGKPIPVAFRLSCEHIRTLQSLAKRHRRTLTEEAKIAFEEYFAKHGIRLPEEPDVS